MNGRVARQLRQLCGYNSKELRKVTTPYIINIRTDKGIKYVINPEGEFVSEDGSIRFDKELATKDIYQLRTEEIRQVYQDLKRKWYTFTQLDHKRILAEEKNKGTEGI